MTYLNLNELMIKCFLFLFSVLMLSTWNLQAQSPQKKVVFIIADGIPADVLEKLHTPHLQEIIGTGVYKRAYVGGEKGTYTQTPTISAPGYMDLITGTWAYKHNVWDNEVAAPNYHYKNIFRLLKEQYPQKKIGIFSTWLDNRTKLVGEGLSQAGNLKFDFHADGFELDTNKFPHDAQSIYTHLIDEHVIAKADTCIRKYAPDLSWIYLEHSDDMGHRHGDGEQLNQSIAYVDKQVGKIWAAIQYREKNFNEDWMIVITTDHGRDAATGKNHGGQSERERTTWLISNKKFDNAYFQQNEPAVVDILPTMARHLGIRIPKATLAELDGIPLVGPVALAKPKVRLEGKDLVLNWLPLKSQGKVKISVSFSNRYKTGGKDVYQEMGKFNLKDGQARITLKKLSPDNFYKVLLESEDNTVNVWLN